MSSAALMSAHPFAFNRNLKARQKGMARCKLNARPDKLTFALRKNRFLAQFQPNAGARIQTAFDGTGLGGEQANDAYQLIDGDVAYVMRKKTASGQGRFGANDQRDLLSNAMQVPILGTLNNIEGRTEEEILEIIQPVGIVEMGNRDNEEDATNLLVSGSITVTNKSTQDICIGDMLMVHAPLAPDGRPEQVFSTNPSEKIGNGKGRVPFVLVPADPSKLDFLNLSKQQRLLAEYEDNPNAMNKHERAIIEGVLEVMTLGYTFAGGLAGLLVLPAVPPGVAAGPAPLAVSTDAGRLDVKRVIAHNVAAAIAIYIADKTMAGIDASKRSEALMLSIQQFIRAMAMVKWDKERLFMGRAMMSARPNEDFELFIRM